MATTLDASLALASANAFAIFLKSQRKWDSKSLQDESIAKFKQRMKDFGNSPKYVLPHGSYLVNLANPDKYVVVLLDYESRFRVPQAPGLRLVRATVEESLALTAECINRAHGETESVVIILENMVRACRACFPAIPL